MLTGYGTLALRTGGSELKSQLYAGYAAPEQYSAAEFSAGIPTSMRWRR